MDRKPPLGRIFLETAPAVEKMLCDAHLEQGNYGNNSGFGRRYENSKIISEYMLLLHDMFEYLT